MQLRYNGKKQTDILQFSEIDIVNRTVSITKYYTIMNFLVVLKKN